MITLLIIIGIVASYVLIGVATARIYRPAVLEYCSHREGDRYWEAYYRRWTTYHDAGIDRDEVQIWTWALIWGWPLFSWVFAIKKSLKVALDNADPKVQQRRIEEQDRRIAELERELRIQ